MKDQDRVIFHIDVNSAFLSFEAVYRLQQGQTLDLREIPCCWRVPGDQAWHYTGQEHTDQKYGIKTGETIWEAKKVPKLNDRTPNYALYMLPQGLNRASEGLYRQGPGL